jgi:hypothetical protein
MESQSFMNLDNCNKQNHRTLEIWHFGLLEVSHSNAKEVNFRDVVLARSISHVSCMC